MNLLRFVPELYSIVAALWLYCSKNTFHFHAMVYLYIADMTQKKMNKLNNSHCQFLFKQTGKIIIVVLLYTLAPNAVAANKGNVSAAVTTLIVGAVIAVLISLTFALQKNQDGKLVGVKTGKFFLLASILLLIVFVTATAAFFIFM